MCCIVFAVIYTDSKFNPQEKTMAQADAKFPAKQICGTCHGRGTIYHTHFIRFGTDDPCEMCKGAGYIAVECASAEEAQALSSAYDKRVAYLKHPDSPGMTPAIVAAVAAGL